MRYRVTRTEENFKVAEVLNENGKMIGWKVLDRNEEAVDNKLIKTCAVDAFHHGLATQRRLV